MHTPQALQAHLCPAAVATEGHAHPRAFPQRMRRHDAHDQHNLASAGTLQPLELHILKLGQPLLAGVDEQRSCMQNQPNVDGLPFSVAAAWMLRARLRAWTYFLMQKLQAGATVLCLGYARHQPCQA